MIRLHSASRRPCLLILRVQAAGPFVDKSGQLIDIHRLTPGHMEAHYSYLHTMLEDYVNETGSAWGQQILDEFDDFVGQFWLVKPKAASLDGLLANISTRSE